MPALYTLLQFTDSLFPSGAFAHSYGLEGLLAGGAPMKGDRLHATVAAIWEHHLLRTDGLIGVHAHRAMSRGDLEAVCDLDRRLFAMKLPRELRTASTDTGRSFLAEARAVVSCADFDRLCARVQAGDSPGNYAVMFQAGAAASGNGEADTLLAWAYQSMAQIAAALLRLGAVGHRSAVSLISRLRPLVEERVHGVLGRDLGDVSSFAPQLEIASMRHERQYSRLFRS